MAHSSSGQGHRPLKAEITGSNPVCATSPWGRAQFCLKRIPVVKSKLGPNGNGIVTEEIWVSGMRQAGFSEQEIDRVVTATATLVGSSNGHGGLVPVKEAARRIGRSENTVRSWIRLGHLPTVEMPPPPSHPNGAWVHVDMADVEELDHIPPIHRHESAPLSDDHLTLRQAAERFGVTLGRLRSWCQRGHLKTNSPRRVGRSSLVRGWRCS